MTRSIRGRHSATRRSIGLGTCAALVTLLAPLVAVAQDVILPEIPFTARHGVSARAAGLGYAYGGVAEDGSALWVNPAGLAQIRKMELGGGLLHEQQNRTVSFDTATDGFPGTGVSSTETEDTQTPPTQITFAYPFPTYRGALVLAFGYQRLAPLSTDYQREGEILARDGATPGLLETETYLEHGSIDFWTIGLAGDVSPKISLGATFSFIDGETSQDFEIGRMRTLPNGSTDVNGSDEVFLSREFRDADISGWTFSIGTLGHLTEQVRLGLTLNGPEDYDLDGFVSSRLEDQEKIDLEEFYFHDEIDLPVSLLGSIAWTPKNFLLTGDARWTDWTQIDFDEPVRSNDRRFAYRTTVDFSLGAEYQFSGTPARVRAGVSFQPLPYQIIPTDVDFTFVPDDGDDETFDDTSFFTRNYEEARFESGRTFITFGAGALLENALAIDIAYVHGTFERGNASGSWTEEWSTDRIYGSATFRF